MKNFEKSIYLLLWTFSGALANLPPVLVSSIDLTVISENTPIGTSVFQLVGRDPENSSVYYSLDGTDNLVVDRHTGVVTIAGPLDREKNDTLTFVIGLEDVVGGGNRNNLVRIPVTVIILDENDNAPRFHQVPYETEVAEDTSPGTTIFNRINVTDFDNVGSILNVQCLFNPEFPDTCDYFSVVTLNSSTSNTVASIVLRKTLNYAKHNSFQMSLAAEDGIHKTSTILNIKVGDVQNQAPIFLTSLVAIVSESTPIGSEVMIVKAIDGDTAIPRKIHYELLTNPGDFFAIDSETGQLTTVRPLDREKFLSTTGIVTLEVRVSEVVNGEPDSSSETSAIATATITIKDVNDEAPKFGLSSYSVLVNENLPNGTPLPGLDMFVQDVDSGTNSVFNLELMDPSGVFSVEPQLATGSTSVSVRIANGPLDFENPNQRKFILLVVAREAFTAEKFSSTATLTISTVDVNDNSPVFEEERYFATLSETASPGSIVTTITATDRDTGVYGEAGMFYSLFGNGADRFLVIPGTGVITVAQCETPGSGNCLDYESTSQYSLSYQAADGNGTGHTTVVAVSISLLDADDNPPYFLQSLYQAVINEGSTTFEPPLQVHAKDLDVTSVPSYSIIAGNNLNLVTIDSSSGQITLRDPDKGLDVSQLNTDVITLTVQARDSGTGVATTTVKITVRDSNNNIPLFEKEIYSASIPESSPTGTFVEQMSATDSDSGVNAELTYRIHRGSFDDFVINSTTGIITVASKNKLDFDKRNEYVMEKCNICLNRNRRLLLHLYRPAVLDSNKDYISVIVSDGGIPSHTSTATVSVQILNNNDKAPYFTPTTQRTEVSEGADIGYTFYKLLARDPDVSSPDFLKFTLSEPVTALDKDGRPVNKTRNEFKEFFAIEQDTGMVKVARELNRDIAAVVTMTVLVIDTSAHPMQQGKGSLVVIIVDRNDFPPSFALPWTPRNPEVSIHLMEEQAIGTAVGGLPASDPDSNIESYRISPESPFFAIDRPSGLISIKNRIDFETNPVIRFTVIAYDTGIPQLSAVAQVTANIVNINDNDPVFSQDSYLGRVRENSPQGALVAVVNATDADSGDFGRLKFSLIGENSRNFLILHDGRIVVGPGAQLDRETNAKMTIQVVATDQGNEAGAKRSRSVPVYIYLEDENDNSPQFSHREYTASIVANISLNPPTPVIQINAKDSDEGLNAKVKYTIKDGNTLETFRIDPDTGVIYPVRGIDEKLKEFRLTVRGQDQDGHGPFSDETSVHIKVVEINQDKPHFVMPSAFNASVQIEENQSIHNYLVMTVKAMDSDRGENGRISYYLKVGDRNTEETEEFHLNSRTGELRTKIVLDREKTSSYKLILAARDNGSPVQFETLNFLTITVKDLDDNVPQFSRTQLTNPYTFTIEENQPVHTLVGRVEAIDLDENENSAVFYYIIDSTLENTFTIDRMAGEIFSNVTFDREQKNHYELVVKATSNANFINYRVPAVQENMIVFKSYKEEDRSLAFVRIRVTDANDNAPYFTEGPYCLGMRNTAMPGDRVVALSAVDPDEGVNGTLKYRFEYVSLFRPSIPGSVRPIPAPFNISQSGEVATTEFMSQYNHAHFHLAAVAQEVGYPHRTVKTIIKVWIYQPDQLIKVIVAQPPEEVNKHKKQLTAILSNATGGLVILDAIRYHVTDANKLFRKWSDLYIYVVDKEEKSLPLFKVLRNVDINAEILKLQYNALHIHNIVPAYVSSFKEQFDPALAAVIAILVVLGVGLITMTVCCFYLKSWYEVKMKKRMHVKHEEIKTNNMIENPLWTDKKYKMYEEQELSMSVVPDNIFSDRSSVANIPDDNVSAVYATLRKPTQNGDNQPEGFHILTDRNEYATLNGIPDIEGTSSKQVDLNPDYHELLFKPGTSQQHSSDLITKLL